MKAISVFLFFAALVISTPSFSETPGEILNEGNSLLTLGKYEDAITAYKKIESADKLGKNENTAGIYASIATSYNELAKTAFSKDAVLAAKLYSLASKYNRAFAAAVMCRHGNCKDSEELWGGNSYWVEQK